MVGAICMIDYHIFVAEIIKNKFMWVVIIALSIFTVLKKKPKKRQTSEIAIFLLLFCTLLINTVKAQSSFYSIYGKVSVPEIKGEVYIYLVNKGSFDTPFSGIDTIICKVDTKIMTFRFNNVLQGEYAIRCFQDLNSNKKLDKSFFMPAEPWSFSWKNEKAFPFNFEDVLFFVKKDFYIELQLNN